MSTEEVRHHEPAPEAKSDHRPHDGGHGHGHGHGAYDPSSLLCADSFYGDVYQEVIGWLKINPGTAALEAGSGAGGVTELLAKVVGEAGSVAALDEAPELLKIVGDRLDSSPFKERVSYHEGDVQRLPFEDGRFDLVWSSRTVHHLLDQLAGVSELCRVLKPGGLLALREGGLRPRFLPSDIGLGEPGLEDRLEAAFQQWFQLNVRRVEGGVRYPHGWTQLLRDAGLTEVTAKTVLLELLPPFNDVQVEYMNRLISRWVESDERRAFISEEDARTTEQLTDVKSPHYAFNRPDLHYMEGITVYLGVKAG